MISRGCQVAVTNEFDNNTGYYKFLTVEYLVRERAKDLQNVYFLCFFACCRENWTGDKKDQY